MRDPRTLPWRSALPAAALGLALLLIPHGDAAAGAPAVEVPGSVMIYSTSVGANVEIDGRHVGRIPFEDSLMVTPGTHQIRVWLRGYTEFIDTFEVRPGEDLELEIDLIPYAGIVKVNTREPGATVKVDGKVEGVTPFDKDIPVGQRTVTITREGYHDASRDLDIRPGQEYVLDIVLDPLPMVAKPSAALYEQWWFWTIIGVAGAGAATAIALSAGGGEQPPPSAAFTLQIP